MRYFIALLILLSCSVSFAQDKPREYIWYSNSTSYSVDDIVNAIYKAEGGAKTRHPYGILKKYKTTTPRQACVNTVEHAFRDWDGKSDFIEFLGSRYCPVNCDNDNGTNQFWVKNVKYFLKKDKQCAK